MTYNPPKKIYKIYIDIRDAVEEYIDGGVDPTFANQLVIIKLASSFRQSGIMLTHRMNDISKVSLGLSSITMNRPNVALASHVTSVINNVLNIGTDKPSLQFTNIESNGSNNIIIVFEE